jgi:Amt family ammonium transporter
MAVTWFKTLTGIDDSLDVFALHGIGGLIGTALTPVFAIDAIAPVTAHDLGQLGGALAVMLYAGVATWVLLQLMSFSSACAWTALREGGSGHRPARRDADRAKIERRLRVRP